MGDQHDQGILNSTIEYTEVTKVSFSITKKYAPPKHTENVTFTKKDVKDPMELLDEANARYMYSMIPLITFIGTLLLVGFVGNLLVVYVYKSETRKSAKRIFILTLALLDLISCLFVMSFEIYDLSMQYKFHNSNLCKVFRMIEYGCSVTGGFVLVSVSFERYFSICRSLKTFTSFKAKCICGVCFMLGLLFAWPSLIFAKTSESVLNSSFLPENVTVIGCECTMDISAGDNGIHGQVYYYVLGIVFAACIIILFIIYAMIATKLRQLHKGCLHLTPIKNSPDLRLSSIENADGRNGRQTSTHSHFSVTSTVTVHGKRDIKWGTTIIFFSVTMVFVLSFLPHLMARIFLKDNGGLLYNWLVRSYMISNATNPFIYSILNSKFRSTLREILKKICRGR